MVPAVIGLSPRVRGNRDTGAGHTRLARTIPACAGEPRRGIARLASRRDYPRVCGGTIGRGGNENRNTGLSPRVRGNLWLADQWVGGERTIPACAGEPRRKDGRRAGRRDYPRVCGGTMALTRCWVMPWGLSPRVRGNHSNAAALFQPLGTIPACAGEPHGQAKTGAGVRDYPRVCGGTWLDIDKKHDLQGLSPRVRGNLGELNYGRNKNRTIPACAGEPRPADSLPLAGPDYPRVCGGTGCWIAEPARLTGLSPRVRGNLPYVGKLVVPVRTIPACAGEPSPAGDWRR